MKTRPILALTCAAALAAASPAGAAIVPGQAVDGPSADISAALPRVDVAPDGSAALVYLKTIDGEEHPFVSRLVNGAWSSPVQVDPGSNDVAEAPRIAVANGGKIVVTARSATVVVAWVSPGAGAPFGASTPLQAAGRYGNVDLAPNGNGYAVSSDINNVVAWRLEGTTWTQVGGAGAVLDNVALQSAGDPNNHEAKVATAPDGASAVAAWGEVAGMSGAESYARRLTGTTLGPAAGMRLDSLPGADPYGMNDRVADQPDVGIDAAGTAWVVVRQNFFYGAAAKNRAIVRPLVGDAFGPYQLVDGMPEPPTEGRDYQRIDVNDAGQGLITHYGNLTNPFEFDTLAGGTWAKAALIETAANETVPLGSPGIGENGSGLVGYRFQAAVAGPIIARARTTLGGAGAAQTLSDPAFGDVTSGVEVAAGSGTFAAVSFLQGAAATRRVVGSVVDLPQPSGPSSDTTAPVVSRLRLSAKRFRLGSALPQVAAVKTGTRIRFNLSEASRVTLAFKRRVPGRRVGGRCVKPKRSNRAARRCRRLVSVKQKVRVTSPSGSRSIRFAGRLTRRKRLKPGPYQLTVTATDAAGNVSSPDRVKFRLLAAKRKRR